MSGTYPEGVEIYTGGARVDTLNPLPVNANVSIGSVTVSGADTVTVPAAFRR